MADMVFYSWQSDLPNATNRGFIQTALEAATKAIRDDESIQVEPVVDRDTAGVPGSPDISSTILGKIDQAQVFVCDVSIINQETKEETRLTPNPNVLIELGYALKALGQQRIIMVMNTASGTPAQLPFDLQLKRVLTYNAPPEASERAPERKNLQRALEAGLRAILAAPRRVGDSLREEAFRNYLDRMRGLMLEGGLREAKPGDAVQTIARTLTLTVLGGLDEERKGALVKFLFESALIHKSKRVIKLKGADLSGADLRDADLRVRRAEAQAKEDGISLRGANLRNADIRRSKLRNSDLFGADLGGAKLERANLGGANLSRADLGGAKLERANFGGANLSRADFCNATLQDANLGGTDLTDANFAGADLRGADLRGSKNLTQEQLESATGDRRVKLPKAFTPPESWSN
ncbi:MAG: pentapeptide repeat-containing protein [Armatimonadetes bacterium]|nr:pentapeptide repeat-containing protein [Armatimonadota bacterium]